MLIITLKIKETNMIDSIIRKRRTIKPDKMNGGIVPDEKINLLLELADWAPTHGRTEPWRFVVYSGNKMAEFCQQHADLYKNNIPKEKFKEASYDKLVHAFEGASHLIIAYMKRGSNPNIPEIEEIAAVSAAIQNLLLGVTAHGLAGFWSTSGMVHHDSLKEYLELLDEDRVLGFLYIGLADEVLSDGKRNILMSEKVRWVK